MSEARPRQRGRSRAASTLEASRKDADGAGATLVSTSARSGDPSAAPAILEAAQRAGFTCPPCGRFVLREVEGVVLRASTGSPSRFCSPACRQAAYRRRRAGVGEDVALQVRGGRGRSLAGWEGPGDE
jgi:hypothetical protein